MVDGIHCGQQSSVFVPYPMTTYSDGITKIPNDGVWTQYRSDQWRAVPKERAGSSGELRAVRSRPGTRTESTVAWNESIVARSIESKLVEGCEASARHTSRARRSQDARLVRPWRNPMLGGTCQLPVLGNYGMI